MSAFTSKKYSYREGFSYKTPAQTVGGVLESIEASGQKITSESFLDASRPEESPTHEMFEWDDSIAAEKYRLQQSHRIINQIEVTITATERVVSEIKIIQNDDSESKETPTVSTYYRTAFPNVLPKRTAETAHFVPIETVLKNDDMRRQVLLNALGELKAFEKKYASFAEMFGVFDAIHKFAEEIDDD